MKTVFLAVNSKYVHTLLAPRYFLANLRSETEAQIYETNINVPLIDVLSDLFLLKPDILVVSCYIFNVEFIRKTIIEIKKLLPKLKIIVGGYEAENNAENWLALADYIIKGEGDFAVAELIYKIENGIEPQEQIIVAPIIDDLSTVNSPYVDDYLSLGDEKIIYYESCRGCPFKCGYCMSSITNRVRAFPLNRVFDELKNIVAHNVKQLKFVDRTFNYDIKRATAIFDFIIENFSKNETVFHFELAPELIDENMLNSLKRARNGLFRFEIGVQTFNETTLKEINRSADIERIEQNLRKFSLLNNCSLHLDLIAGLPSENFDSFVKSFNKLFTFHPNCLQLGFLKLLKGSPLYTRSSEYSFTDFTPYEVTCAKELSFAEIIELKRAEKMLEIFYNSGRYRNSVLKIIEYVEPFACFHGLYTFYEKRYPKRNAMSAYMQADLLFDFAKSLNRLTENELKCLETAINDDFSFSGNPRKWHRN